MILVYVAGPFSAPTREPVFETITMLQAWKWSRE